MSQARAAAVIDVGTNSVLLTIARRTRTAEGTWAPPEAELERATITRLGEGVDRNRRLAPQAIERTLACLREYGALIQRAGVETVALVGTSALRDAEGAEAFREQAGELVGAPLEVICGVREAELTFRGALSGLHVQGAAVVFDIGGGSTEIIEGTVSGEPPTTRYELGHSYDVGSVRLTERHLHTDPPSPEELAALCRDVRATWAAPATPGPLRPAPEANDLSATVVGVAGTVTTLASLALGLDAYDPNRVHGAQLPRTAIEDLVERLAALPLAARQELPGLEPRRADVIVAGALLCREVLQHLGASELLVSDRGVRWGLLDELLGDD